MADALTERIAGVEHALVAAVIFGDHEAELLANIAPEDFSAAVLGDAWRVGREVLRDRGSVDEVSLVAHGGIDPKVLEWALRMRDAIRSPGEHVSEFAMTKEYESVAFAHSEAGVEELLGIEVVGYLPNLGSDVIIGRGNGGEFV